MDHRWPSLTAIRKSEELPLTVGHRRMFKLAQGAKSLFVQFFWGNTFFHEISFGIFHDNSAENYFSSKKVQKGLLL
jgi:hypothetical protein